MAKFDLCPKCGAVSRDGLCSSCGYKVPGVYKSEARDSQKYQTWSGQSIQQENGQNVQQSVQPNLQPQAANWGYVSENSKHFSVDEEAGKKSSTAAIVSVLVVFILICCGIITVSYISGKEFLEKRVDSIEQHHSSTSFEPEKNLPGISVDDELSMYGNYPGRLADIIAYNKEYFVLSIATLLGEDEYIGSDPEAYDFDTYITEDVPYGIYEDYWYYENSEGRYDSDGVVYPHNLVLYGNYFYLADTGLESEDDINQRIFEEAVRAADQAEYVMESGVRYSQLEVYSTSYVTYIDESVISIAYYATSYYRQPGDTDDEGDMYSLGSYISAVSFDLKTGKELKASEVFDFGGAFVNTFKERCYEQNGSPVDYYSDAELEKILLSDGEVFWAYTPLGLEVGVNRKNYTGWSTGTFTNFEAFLK